MKKQFILFVIGVCGLAIILFAGGVVADHYVKSSLGNHLTSDYSSQEQTIGNQVASTISGTFTGIENSLYAIAQDTSIQSLDASVCNPTIARYYANTNLGIGNIGRVNPQGIFYCSINKALIGKPASSLGSYVQTLFNDPNHNPVVSPVIVEPGLGTLAVAMHVPVYNVQHQFVGSLGGAVFLKQLSQTLGKIRFAQTGYASLQDNNGTIIFSHKPKNIGKNYFSPYIQNQPGANLVQLNKAIYSARKGVTSNVTYVTTGAVTKIATVIPVTITPGHRWIIIVSVPKTEIAQTFIHSGLNNSFNVVLAILAIVILIVVGALIATNFAAYKLQLAKDQFISLVSHQLRTPLTSIRLFSEMLSDPRVGKLNEKQHEYVDKVHLSTIRMISLVGDILNVSRIELKRLKVEPIETNLVEYLNTCIAEVQPIADEKKIKITTHIPEHPINLKVDQTLFGQIVHNLLTNAVRYTAEEDGEVDVTLKKISRGGIELTVSDNGIGIPEKSQKKIFERFYRADNAVKTIGDGTGLGLYLIKMILNTTGGKIWFESKENKGSTFHVTIPKTGMARNTVVRKKK